MRQNFGEAFAALRRERTDLSLRKFCEKFGFDPGYLSKMERGRIPPPPGFEKLKEYLVAVGIEEFSDEWFELLDKASTARRELPHDFPDDEEVLELAPLLFREMRGDDQKISRERLLRIIQFLREV